MIPSTILYVEDDEEYSTSKWYATSLIYCKNSSPGKYKIAFLKKYIVLILKTFII